MVSANFSIFIIFGLSIISYILTKQMIPLFINKFLSANISGIDVHKASKPKLPESFGVVTGCIFLVTCFIFLPILYSPGSISVENFPHNEFVEMVASLLSICCMLLLGFIDDIFDLRWRHKLFFPTLASLPLLIVYHININSTTVLIPRQLRHIFGVSVDLGILYYIYMGMLAVFCTNAINIYAGVNGLEVGQSVIIALSVFVFNIIEYYGSARKSHVLSLYFILPFLGVSSSLLKYNWFPARVFVGDTYCYFAGMLFAVIAILGHFSKTMLLFFIPQVFNFIYSLPQLLHFIPCPRHRFPLLTKSGVLEPSYVEFSLNEISLIGKICFGILQKFHLIKVYRKDNIKVKCNNLTLLNITLVIFGSMHEEMLTTKLLMLQIICTGIAFTIRYPLASLFYDV
ncbi:hypothetical protein PGB90_005482 [Kerria lacca]